MTSTPIDHPLANVMWTALTTSQADWSRGNALARRFRPEFARFAGMPAVTAANLRALAADMACDEIVALSDADDFDPGPLFDVSDRKNLVQMIGPATGEARAPQRFRPLGPADVPRMTALVQLTEPGPWYERTPELGRFVGFEAEGQLVAMVGERMRVPGHTEISAVCCHPDWRGRGLPSAAQRGRLRGVTDRGRDLVERETDRTAGGGDDPEAQHDLRLRPPFHLEVVVNRGHLEHAPVKTLEGEHLDQD